MLIEKFEETVEAFPGRIAIKMEAETYTYKQLNRYANRVAAQIIASPGLSYKGKQAALLFEHGADMIIGLIAALKANMVYMPLDRTYPGNRLVYMLENSESALILTNTANLPLAQRLAKKIKRKIEIMDLQETGAGESEGKVTRTVSGKAPAYILYTSGSTGRPKGVIQNHDNVLYYTRNWVQRFSLTPGDRMTLLTAFSHDGFVQDLWSALLSGAALYPYDVKNIFDRTRLPEFIKNEKITIWHSVPTLFRYFTDSITPGEIFPYLRFILLGGEPLRKHDIDIFKGYFPHAVLANVYGQTESSVNSIALYTREDVFGLPILGEPLDKTKILLVTEEGEILEDLGTGEIVIACDHLAPGYWRDDESTRERFTHDPDLGKLYWTGDLGRLKGNREIAIIGRKDLQIKIRGFRVEVGEIETVLLQHESVKEAAVILKETKENGPYLCCYFSSKEPVDAARLREYLLHQVPDYMIPTTFIQLAHLPLTPSGKIDRNALPEPGTEEMEKKYKPPVTAVEKQLAGIWQEVLNLKPGHPPIGIDDNFFEMGGHSLRAIRLIARTHKTFQVKLELEEVFSFPTLRELAQLIDGKSREAFTAIHPVEKKEYYPLSSAQKRLVFLQQMEPEGTGYNLSGIMEFEKEIDIKRVEQTFRQLIQRHESLRTSFHLIDDQPVQKVHDAVEFEIEYNQVKVKGRAAGAGDMCRSDNEGTRGLAPLSLESPLPLESTAALISSFVRPFDLGRPPLFRVGVTRLDKNKNIFMMDMHHIISDGTSQEIFSEDFKRLYEGRGLVSLKLQYKDYAQWQKGEIDRGVLKQQETYWLNQFNDEIPVLQIPIDFNRPLTWSFEGDSNRFVLPYQEAQQLRTLAQKEDATLYMVLLAAVNVLLYKLSDQEDIIIGTPVAGRRHADLEEIIGMFVNTLVLRNFPGGQKTFATLLKEVREKTMKAFENQEYPFEELVDRVVSRRDMSRNPLFDVMFVLHNQSELPVDIMRMMNADQDTAVHFKKDMAKFDLTFHAVETSGETLGFSVEYSTNLFKKESIERFLNYFRQIVSSAIINPHQKIFEIEILPGREKKQLLFDFNNTKKSVVKDKNYYQLFADQVSQTPNKIAAIYDDSRITYHELNKKAGNITRILVEHGVSSNTLVALYFKRSITMLAAVISVFKSGGAYLPLEKDYPLTRIKYILEDSQVKIILTENEHLEVLRDIYANSSRLKDIHFVHPDQACLAESLQQKGPLHNRPGNSGPNDLAYIIYTSGTTGNPKGVMIHQLGMINHIYAKIDDLALTGEDIIAQTASASFDISVWQFLAALLNGGATCIIDKEIILDSREFLRELQQKRVTILEAVPSLITTILEACCERVLKSSAPTYRAETAPGQISNAVSNNKGCFPGATPGTLHHPGPFDSGLNPLRRIISTGEPLTVTLVRQWYRFYPGIKLVNAYGPTEASDDVTHYLVNEVPPETQTAVPIGKPVQNLHVYILDKHLSLCPVGVRGEICVAGLGVGKGYWKDVEKTSHAFVPNPYIEEIKDMDYAVLYKTGDIGYVRADGHIECLGRLDHQVKIRGHRVELGEIERRLLNHERVKETVVTARTDSPGDSVSQPIDKYLCAYIVPVAGGTFDKNSLTDELKGYLSQSLPDYMIPAYFVVLEKIPLTPNGKIDKKALPKPAAAKAGEALVPPANELEKQLLNLWAAVLGIEETQIGVMDNFFEMGGHSLKATTLVFRIHKIFNVRVPLAEFFKAPYIRGIARYLQQAAKDWFAEIRKAKSQEYYPLSSAQKRLYIVQQMEEDSTAYNILHVIPLDTGIDKEKLAHTFRQLIERHESLRTSFHMVDNQPVQKIYDKVEFKIEHYQVEVELASRLEGTRGLAPLSIEPAAITIKNFIRPFDLSQAPLFRVGLLEQEKGKPGLLLVDIHHIISDGVSTDIMTKDFTALSSGQSLPGLRVQYKDYAQWQNSPIIREAFRKQETYWLKVLADEIPVLQLPYDFPRPGVQSFAGGKIDFEIGKKETANLKQLALARGATLYMVLLAAFTLLMSKLSGQEDIIIGTPTAGRRHPDLENIIGMFVNTLVLRNQPRGEETFNTFLNEIKINTLEAFENQDYQFEDLVEKVAVNRDIGRNPLFDVMFTMQHMDGPKQTPLSPGEEPVLFLYHSEGRAAKFDLTMEAIDAKERILLSMEYAAKLFNRETIERFTGYLKTLISEILVSPGRKLSEINIIPVKELQRILYAFNDTAVDYPQDKTIQQLFREQVEQTPDKIALVGKEEGWKDGRVEDEKNYKLQSTNYKQLEALRADVNVFGEASLKAKSQELIAITYKELNQKSGQLAHLLREKGVGIDTVVAIMSGRSIEMIIGILGILKAGGVYMPIEPGYPRHRVDYMLKDSSAGILLTGQEIAGIYSPPAFKIRPKGTSSHPHPPLAPARSLAYVIYTSGTTGWPKGVMIQHRNIVNTLIWRRQEYRMGSTDVSLQLLSFCFDAFVTCFFTPVISGARVILLAEEEVKDINKIREAIPTYNVTHFNAVPILVKALMETITVEEALCLKAVTLGGDKIWLSLLGEIKRKNPAIEIFYEYGVTEASVISTLYRCQGKEDRITIGKPTANTAVVILDKINRLQPLGVSGELCISGVGLARGYLNNPQLTADKFNSCSHMSYMSHMSYIYRSGDLARWLADGNIEFLGRIDFQVKIRGFRIETGEIENQLLNYKDVTAALVISTGDGAADKYLCAYIAGDKEIGIPPLREYLSHSLPYYMIPAYIIQVEKIPLTVHGKVNRQALPKPLIEKSTAVVAPRNWWEEQMAVLWAEVLGVAKEMLSIDTNFFEIGGQSLKATILSAKIQKALEVKIPLVEIFKTPTIRGLADYIKKTAPNQGYTAIEPVEKKDYYALSPTQEGIYIVQRLDPSSTAYHIPFFLEVKGTVDKQRYEEAFRALINRHGSLRTSFDLVNGEPVQKIHDTVEFEIEYYDLKVAGALIHGDKWRSDNEGTRGLAPLSIENFIRPFDLSLPPLFRVGMIRWQEKKHILMVDIHHIVSDGTSINILVRDFLALYQGLELPPQPIQYKDYSQWRNSRQQKEVIARQEKVWLKEFPGELPLLNLPLDFPRPPVQEFAGKALTFKLSTKETQEVKNFVLKERVTIYMMVLSVFTVLLAKLSGQEDIIVGTPAAGRNHENLQSIVGMFVNTLALRNFPVYYQTFREFLHSVKEKTLIAFENQDFAFEELVNRLRSEIARDKGRNPIFDVMVAPQDIETTVFKLPGLTLEPYRNTGNRQRTAKFDLTLIALETPEQLFFTLVYRTRLFKEETIRRFINYFKKIFAAVVENPQKRIGEIEIITGKERQQILTEFNNTTAGYPADKTLHQLFAEQAARTPDHIALVGAHQLPKLLELTRSEGTRGLAPLLITVTYKELNEKSNQVARYLIERGAGPDTIVSIMMERSIDMIIGLMGILKAGVAYLPIDPGCPPERINYMLADSAAKILLATESTEYTESASSYPATLLPFHPSTLPPFPHSTLPPIYPAQSSNLAYIIYTSGSTGKPKGVIIEHRNAVNVVTWYAKHYHLDCHTRVLQLSSYTFDASVNQVFGPLTHGAGLYLVSKELLDNIEKLRMYIEANDITIVHHVPLFLRELLLEHPRIKSIKVVISGGDLLEKTIKDKFLERGYTLYNQYGPTETTVNVFAGQCGEGKVALGRPIANTVCLILDNSDHLCPVGITGELCLAGAGVSRGYLNSPERTAEKFVHDLWDYLDYHDENKANPLNKNYKLQNTNYKQITNYKLQITNKKEPFRQPMQPCNHAAMPSPHLPITPLPHSPIYKTGDLGRWLSDGRVEFLGRLDHQVKIRGSRVELGEIESHLHRIDGVKDAVVIAREGQSNEKYLYLCAYVVAGEAISMLHLKDELAKRLPTYMIPDFFVPLEEIPMTPIGKLNRKALPEPTFPVKKNKCPVPPRNHIEKKLVEIWLKILLGKTGGDESFGIDDSFFELGGNSIKAIRSISEIYKTFNVEVPMALIFKTPFIRSISAHLMQHKFTAAEEEIVLAPSPGKTGSGKIFCFPPAIGYGIVYMGLVTLLSRYSLYGFNYIEDEDKDRDKMEKYVEAIMEIQPQGPYTLLGYSAGGRLCLKAAELLEKRGYQVKDIILLDCYSQRKSLPEEVMEERNKEFLDGIKQGLQELGLEPMTDKVMATLEKYGRYHDLLMAQEPEPIHADIHLIKAEDKQGREGFIGWEAFTRGKYCQYEGFGNHKEMLSAGFIEKNAAVINGILTSPEAGAKKETRPVSLLTSEKIRQAHEMLSACNVKFLDFVGWNPGALIAANYREMKKKSGIDEMQPWPTFIDGQSQRAQEQAALTTCNLIRSIPKRIFNYDPYRMSKYYQLPVNMIETQLKGVTDKFLESLIGRGDFVLTSTGYKCLEYNIAGNIGGIHLSFEESYYLENPIIKGFLKEKQIKIKNRDVITIFLEHLVATAQEVLVHTNNHFNIALVARGSHKGTLPGEANETDPDDDEIEIALNQKYAKTLAQLDKKLHGSMIFCDFADITAVGDNLYYKDQPIHVLVETYEGAVPPEILHLFKNRRICLFNGPVTGLMSNKLNLALLSEHEDSSLFSETEREAIKTYIPWTRKILASETLYQGEKIQLVDFIRQNREQLVMKPAVGYGGEGVAIGKYTPANQWETVLQTVLQKGKWLVQEYLPSLPLLYQYGENGAEPHRGVLGFLVFGNRYGSGSIRLLPCSKQSGVINVHQGARASILFEVE